MRRAVPLAATRRRRWSSRRLSLRDAWSPAARQPTALLGQPALAQLAALLLGGAAPDAGLLVGGQGELEALGVHRAHRADPLGRLDLVEGEAGGADGEEEVGIGVPAQRAVRHASASQSWVRIQVRATRLPFGRLRSNWSGLRRPRVGALEALWFRD